MAKPEVVGGALAATVATILAAVAAVEGGYANHPADPGGETNHGVTIAVARAEGYTGSMRALTKEQAREILHRRYVARPGLLPVIAIDAAVGEELVDSAVNFGPSRPLRWYQQALNAEGAALSVDGVIGPRTLAEHRDLQARVGRTPACLRLLDALDARQLAEYQRLVRANARLKVFYRGWVNNRIGNVSRAKCGGQGGA